MTFSVIKLLAALLLVLLNGFFVLAEFSMVKVRKTRLEELVQQGDRSAALALKIVSSFDSYLGATQLGVTLASLALGWIGEPAVASLLEPLIFAYFPGSNWLLHTISVALGFLAITFLHVVIGELVPKSIAIQRVERVALFTAWPLYMFHKLGYPVIVLFYRTAKAILGLMGVKPASEIELAHSEEELRLIVSASQRGGVLDKMESELIDNVFDFADRVVREVMVPRQDMTCIFTDDTFEENMKAVRETGHTRYPLCLEDKDHVIGMIHIRDLMDFNMSNNDVKDFRSIMREILVVPENMPVAQLLQLMKRKRTHLAVVADEYGGTAGLVAMEDVIEEIVGDIQDEHDEEEVEILRLTDGTYEFDGRVLLEHVGEILHLRLEEHEEDTIGGYIFGILGRGPKVGDQVNIDMHKFRVLQVTGFRVVRVKAEKIPKEAVEKLQD